MCFLFYNLYRPKSNFWAKDRWVFPSIFFIYVDYMLKVKVDTINIKVYTGFDMEGLL